ncbi:MAG: hypothetical protein IKC53_03595 [Lentisphaeria bacterium]|nr:hypothetical protein [Lentisphaeria bacterium]
MTAFLAIVKLTIRSAVRSHIFRLLLILLLLSIFLLPFTLLGDGTPKGEVQIFLQYCLGFVGFILCLSSVWLACSEVSSDVETAQIHMIAVKPVRRAVVLVGKYTGVVLIHLALLLIAAVAVYAFLSFRLASAEMSDVDRMMLNEQVLTARALYKPVRPDFNALAQAELDHRIAQAKEHGQDTFRVQDDQMRQQAFLEIRKELIATYGLVARDESVYWTFEGLPKNLTDDDVLFLRYTIYVNRYYTQDQNSVRGHWVFGVNYTRPDDNGGETVVTDLMALPEDDFLTAAQNEMVVPIRNSYFVYDGTAQVGFLNKDTKTSELNFEEGRGPFLLIREAGFFSNYCRAILVLAIGILSVTLLASAVAACMSLPIAIFFSAAYMLTGGLANYMVTSIPDSIDFQAEYTGSFGYKFGELMLNLIVPLQDFFVTGYLANGELIDFPFIGMLFAKDFVLRMLPVFLFGAWIYTRRELALVSKRG